MKKLLILLTAVIVSCSAWAQAQVSGKITGTVTDSLSGQGLAFASVSLLNPQGKTVNGALTDDNGNFVIENVPAGSYRLQAAFVGYLTKTSQLLELKQGQAELNAGALAIAPDAEVLEGVTVEGQKALYENKIDKLVYNAERDATNSGGNAGDVLRKVPMVTVDLEGSVQLRGSGNVRVLINGKPSSVIASNVEDALKMIPSDEIKSVEVITSPSAKYDAEGTAGIINIITKKKGIQGLSGNVNLSAGTRNSNAGLDVNYRKNRFGINAGLGGNLFNSNGYQSSERINNASDANRFLLQEGNNDMSNSGLRGQFGMDYDIDTTSNISTSIRFNDFSRDFDNYQGTIMMNAGEVPVSQFSRNTDGSMDMEGLDWTMDYRKTFKRPQQELTASAQYSKGTRGNGYDLFQTNEAGEINLREKSFNDNLNKETTFQVDYIHPFKKEGTVLEAGAKSILRDISSDYQFSIMDENGAYIPDPSRSNVFDYRQDVYAAYTTFAFKFGKKYGLKLGARWEQTQIDGDFASTGTSFSNTYGNLIPSITLSRELKPGQTIKASYSRRIQRPSLWFLNPYVDQSDSLNVRYGNPELKPELSNSYELGWSTFFKKTSLNASLYWRNTSDVIESVSTIEEGVTSTTFSNVSSSTSVGLNLFGSTQITPKWTVSGSVNLYDYRIKSNVDNQYSNESFMYNLNMNSNLSFGEGFSASLFAMFNSPRTTLQGTSSSWSMMSVGLKKELFDKKASIGINVNNPYKKHQEFKRDLTGVNFTQNSVFGFEFRSVSLNFSYRFGKVDFKQQRRRRGGIDNNDQKQGDGNQMGM
ncbi:outer membrane receptor protein involved in Fe transport [Anseongella ginsenosidimutans]|uniref:Outer membrane receptor protein involved in Fe transport n=1 Tax=Anseongella ginsenosidimutans TaxID=496056 RepID=A0A4R3KPK4_9SPHI|nr:TonB-dependent receptor [Anseongella ginsenosidimutans]QEC54028.1 TonB-dependent receptor [Anseongella ginsenosidimutans]TCS85207.1 outer membrane receptor protein involved in Fe transport [Anseongella ginsenosidimutans]